MKPKCEFSSEVSPKTNELSLADGGADSSLDARAEQLFQILQEIEDLADNLNDEQFCGLVHQAVTSCGFTDAIDAWLSLLAVTERRIALIDLRDVTPQPPDMRN